MAPPHTKHKDALQGAPRLVPQVTVPESYDTFKGLLLDLIYDRAVPIEPAAALQASRGSRPPPRAALPLAGDTCWALQRSSMPSFCGSGVAPSAELACPLPSIIYLLLIFSFCRCSSWPTSTKPPASCRPAGEQEPQPLRTSRQHATRARDWRACRHGHACRRPYTRPVPQTLLPPLCCAPAPPQGCVRGGFL